LLALQRTGLPARRAYLTVLATLWALAISLYVVVGVVDPYRLRFSHLTAGLADHPYPFEVTPRLASVASADGTDMLVFGASTSAGYTPAMLRAAFPDVQKPFNLSYLCASAADFERLAPVFECSTTLRRIIFNLDVTFARSCEHWDSTVSRYFGPKLFAPEPEFNLEAIELTAYALITGKLDLPDWRPQGPDRTQWNDRISVLSSPRKMELIRKAVSFARPWVTAGERVECGAFPTLGALVRPFLKTMSRRGVEVDVLLPPYSLAFYYDQSVRRANAAKLFPGRGSVFANFMAIRRCTLEMVEGLPHVRVHEFTTDLALTGDLSHYTDVAHLGSYETYAELLRRIAHGEGVVMAAEWPGVEAQIKKAVDEFEP
jgi:hypothetical protein